MNLAELRDLYRHMEWADASVWRAVCAAESALDDQKLRNWFYHLHLVQRAFLRAWRNEPADAAFPTFEDAKSVRDCRPSANSLLRGRMPPWHVPAGLDWSRPS